jgi:hypothetical protein
MRPATTTSGAGARSWGGVFTLDRLAITVAILAVVAVGLAGCGGHARDPVVVRVGTSAITKSQLVRWMSVLAPDHEVPDPPTYAACVASRRALTLDSVTRVLEQECEQQYRRLRERALHALISAAWLIGEARDRGVAPSRRMVEERLAGQKRMLPATGATLADAELKIEAELAANRLRALVDNGSAITRAEIARYYRQHLRRFERAEVRDFDIAENLESEAAARAVMRKIESDATRAGLPLHEKLARPIDIARLGAKKVIVQAIFAAKPHVLSGPTPMHGRYALFEVTRISPATREPLARVERPIERMLRAERQRRALARLVATWRRRWIAKTVCGVGYVVQKCRNYHGSSVREGALSLD